MCNTTRRSRELLIDEGMESEIPYLIGSQDLKLHFVETCWSGSRTLKQSRLSRIGESEFT
jgi:hypothetical protein